MDGESGREKKERTVQVGSTHTHTHTHTSLFVNSHSLYPSPSSCHLLFTSISPSVPASKVPLSPSVPCVAPPRKTPPLQKAVLPPGGGGMGIV